jgi:xylose isomerase
MARRRSPDKSLQHALRALDRFVEGAETVPYADAETFAARMTAVAKAVDVLRKVEESAWRSWSPRRLRDLSDDELAAELERDAARAHHRGPLS